MRPSRFLASVLVLLLACAGGSSLLAPGAGVAARVVSTDDAAANLSGTFQGVADGEAVAGSFTVSGVATAATGDVLSVEVYLDGAYLATALSGVHAASLSYSCPVDVAALASGLHRIDAVAYGGSGIRRRIGGAWFHAEPLSAGAAFAGLPSDGVLTSDRTVTAQLVASDSPVVSVEVRVDGATVRTIPVSPATRRPSVSFSLARAGLSTGRHALELVATGEDGVSRVAATQTLQVPRGGGAIDQPADLSLTGLATVSGYVLHGASHAKVEAYLSSTDLAETKVASGAPGRERTEASLGADVLAASPLGFALSFDTRPYPDGEYTLRIVAVPASGDPVPVETRYVYIDNADGAVTNVDPAGAGVNVRSLPTTQTPAVLRTTLKYGTTVDVLAVVHGESRTDSGTASDLWYRVRFTKDGVVYGTDAAPCYIYAYYVDTDPALRRGSISAVVFDGMSPYGGFAPSRRSYTSVIPHETDRFAILRLYRFPGGGEAALTLDGASVPVAAPVVVDPGSHELILSTVDDGSGNGASYKFFVLRLAEQLATTNAAGVNVRTAASSGSAKVLANYSPSSLPSGYQVVVKATVKGEYLTTFRTDLWYQVRFSFKGKKLVGGKWVTVDEILEGYIFSAYLKLEASGDDPFILNLAAFPTSYHAALWDLHIRHPYWTFEAVSTGLDWATAVAKESEAGKGRNLTPYYSSGKSSDCYSTQAYDYSAGNTSSGYIGGGYKVYDSPNWVAASPKMTAYFMDPRNFLNDAHIFQFEWLGYNADSQTAAGVEAILSGGNYMGNGRTFAYQGLDEANDPATFTMTYAQAFVEAAARMKVSPFHLASKARMEVSTSSAHTGTVAGYDDTHVVLQQNANPNDDFYNGFKIRVTSGSTSQTRTILDYDGASRTAAVAAFSPALTGTWTYSIGGSTTMGGYFLISSALGTLGVGATAPADRYDVCRLPEGSQHTDQTAPDPNDPTATIFVHYFAGYFNFYNIGAYPDPSVNYGAQKNGIRYAQWGGSYSEEILTDAERQNYLLPWTDPYKAIVGGAGYIAAQYIYSATYGQDTMHFEKFNVLNAMKYISHQYVQNVQAADDEGNLYYRAYVSSGKLESAVRFRIPVYENMPTALSPRPTLF